MKIKNSGEVSIKHSRYVAAKNYERSKSETATAEELRAIYRDLNDYASYDPLLEIVRMNLVMNPNTPIEVLIDLGSFYIYQLLRNPALELIRLEYPEFDRRVASNFYKYYINSVNFLYSKLNPQPPLPKWIHEKAILWEE